MTQTVLVWILVAFIDGYKSGAPLVIDNIATKAECERLLKVVGPSRFGSGEAKGLSGAYCTPVRKVRQ